MNWFRNFLNWPEVPGLVRVSLAGLWVFWAGSGLFDWFVSLLGRFRGPLGWFRGPLG